MIAVVDDDVGFAEEIQDLLATHGHRSVVVVTHPHASSLALLDAAQLLILDLALAATTALDVLEELRSRGNTPTVVMVSGSGSDVLEAARANAIDRGFPVLGALPKPVVATDLLDLLAIPVSVYSHGQSGPNAALLQGTHILACSSLDYAGSYLQPEAATFSASPCVSHSDPNQALVAAVATQRALASHGRHGFVVVPLPNAALLDPVARAQICTGFGQTRVARSQIVLDLRPELLADPASQVDALVDLRLAGYGLMLRSQGDTLLPTASLIDLPITVFAIDAELPRRAHGLPDLAVSLGRTMDYLRRRAITSLCIGLQSANDLRHARDLGFNLVSGLPG